MPRPKRFYEVGVAIRKAIESIPGDRRVGVLVSGHLSLEIGGPRQFGRHLMDPQFDADAGFKAMQFNAVVDTNTAAVALWATRPR